MSFDGLQPSTLIHLPLPIYRSAPSPARCWGKNRLGTKLGGDGPSPRVCYFQLGKSCDLPAPKRFSKLKKNTSSRVCYFNLPNILTLLYICIRNTSLSFISFPTLPPVSTCRRNVDGKSSTCAYLYALEAGFSKLSKIA